MSEASPWKDVPTLGTAVVEFLAAEILRGRWPDGYRLPETLVAEELGTSRGPVREAFRVLADQGFVTLRPRVGAIIHRASSGTIKEIYEMRSILEGWTCLQAVRALDPKDIEQLHTLLSEMEARLQAADYAAFYETGWRFRRNLYLNCSNSLVLREVEALRARLYSLPSLAWRSGKKMEEHLHDYQKLLAAIDLGRAEEAAEIIKQLLKNTGDAVARYFEELQSVGRPVGRRAGVSDE
jgi:DNA-binding GntR family transcriptional regulator